MPLIVLLEQDGTDETDDGVVVLEDAHDLGAALDLAVEALAGVRNRYKTVGAEVWLRSP